MLKFSEFASEAKPLDGRKVKIAEILNKKIVVINFKIKTSNFTKGCWKYVAIQTEIEGERFVSFTGSGILIEQLEKYGEHVPFMTVIRQIDKYYTFS